MNWYRDNRWLGNFLIACGAALLILLWFVFHSKGSFDDAQSEFNAVATERSRLEHLNPFPNEENFRKTQAALDEYGATLNKLKNELQAQVLPASPLVPNEFQSRLRQAIVVTTEKARANRVKLPENFHLGFDEFTTTLPTTTAAPLLGRELAQIELLLGLVIDAHVDAITSVKRRPPAVEPASVSKPLNAKAQPQIVECETVDLSFTAAPSAMRKVFNQMASSERQFFVVRNLYVRNDQLTAPSREQTAAAANTTQTVTGQPNAVLKFIVGNEHVETTTTIELVRFAF